ncbi:hypothetical protein CU669_07150 [Paramagnetospirillum kuznetsovii]|uniref:Uncharacterized protein n=2 Tax=Paramagnetospirillum kuznetsovii TaxID=2053833 RepID=A0A364NZQ0_9PROT|nr:hypothetical protein CU669_07150 [Paramagnetospirillum kuznetsovii]
MTDAETVAIGLAYPGTVQGRIISAWRHGSLELVLEITAIEDLAHIFYRLAGRLGWSVLEVNDLIAAIRLNTVVLPPGSRCEPPATPRGRKRLPCGATHCVTENEALLAMTDTYPVITPEEFWSVYG